MATKPHKSEFFGATYPLLNGEFDRLMRIAGARPRPLGTIVDRCVDEAGNESKTMVAAIGSCPRCGQQVELLSETDEWVRTGSGWKHKSYGPPSGQCCGLAFIIEHDRSITLDLDPQRSGAESANV